MKLFAQQPRQVPAAAIIKYNPQILLSPDGAAIVIKLLYEKGFSLEAAQVLNQNGNLAALLAQLVAKEDRWGKRELDLIQSNLAPALQQALSTNPTSTSYYNGSREHNQAIASAIVLSPEHGNELRSATGIGSARLFDLRGPLSPVFLPLKLRQVPIIIAGAGPAGLMTVRALTDLGFENITVIDPSGEYGGIWRKANVVEGSKNNPGEFGFGHTLLEAAPGRASTVAEFLDDIVFLTQDPPIPLKGKVIKIVPGDLEHKVIVELRGDKFGCTQEFTAPIVINTMGLGKPKKVNDPSRMISDTPKDAGVRWQEALIDETGAANDKARRTLKNKTVVLIGLGNSTIEMLHQIQTLNDRGFNIDYQVMTHYPEESLSMPSLAISHKDKTFAPLFRDVKLGRNLVDLEADLAWAREAYDRALLEGRISSRVCRWGFYPEEHKFIFHTAGDKEIYENRIRCDRLYTLIGYEQSIESKKAMGMSLDEDGYPLYDYDGEFQKEVPGERYQGCYGLGAVLQNPWDENTLVMPGIMHRLPDMIFSIIMEAARYALPSLR